MSDLLDARYDVSGPDRAVVDEFCNWLTEQGIPVDKLLSGDMVAVEKEWAQGMMEGFVAKFSEAQLAGNPPVTPEGCQEVECGACERMIPADADSCPHCCAEFPEKALQEPTGATHSEKPATDADWAPYDWDGRHIDT